MFKFFAKKNCFNLNFTRYAHFVVVLKCEKACFVGKNGSILRGFIRWGVVAMCNIFCILRKINFEIMQRMQIFCGKKLSRVAFMALFILLVGVSCSSVRTSATPKASQRVAFRSLGVDAFARVVAKDNVVLVDVRTPEEYAAGHLEGVDYNLDVRSATFFKDFKNLPADKLIALYCKGGGRSKQVAGVLAGNGYKVVELAVGYDCWVKAGGKVEK